MIQSKRPDDKKVKLGNKNEKLRSKKFKQKVITNKTKFTMDVK